MSHSTPTPALPSGIPLSDIHIEYINGNIIVGCVNCANTDGVNPCLSDREKAYLSLQSSLAHFRRRVLEIGIANTYELFCTFTFLAAVGNDIQQVKKLISWMRNHARYKGYTLHFLAVLAPGKDGGHWHWHMLVSGIPREELVLITRDSECLTSSQRKRLWYQQLYHWQPFLDKYGSIHEIVRIGERDMYGNVIEKTGKVIYMSRQYDAVPTEHFPPPKTRKIHSDAKAVRPAHSARCCTSQEDLKAIFTKFGGAMGRWGGRLVVAEEDAPSFLRELEARSLYSESDLLATLEKSKGPAAFTPALPESGGPPSDG